MEKSTNKKEVAATSPNSVVPFDRSVLSKGIAVAKEITPAGGGNADIMKVSDGKIVMGMDQEVVEANEEWLVNPGLIYFGYICWKEGKPIDQKHRNFAELAANGAYTAEGLPDHGPYSSEMDGWSEQLIMGMVAKKDGLKTVFPATALGGRTAIQKVADAIGEQDERGSEFLYPIVTVTADSYFNKKFRKDIYFPVFTVVRWENDAGESE